MESQRLHEQFFDLRQSERSMWTDLVSDQVRPV